MLKSHSVSRALLAIACIQGATLVTWCFYWLRALASLADAPEAYESIPGMLWAALAVWFIGCLGACAGLIAVCCLLLRCRRPGNGRGFPHGSSTANLGLNTEAYKPVNAGLGNSSSSWTSQHCHIRSSRGSSSSGGGCASPHAAALVNTLYVGFLLWVCVAACGCANFMLDASAVADGAATVLLFRASGSHGSNSRRGGAAGPRGSGDGTAGWGAHSSMTSTAGIGPGPHGGRRGLQDTSELGASRQVLPVCPQGCLATGAYTPKPHRMQGGLGAASDSDSDSDSTADAATLSAAGGARAGVGAWGDGGAVSSGGSGSCVCDRATLRALYSYATGLHDQLAAALTALAALFGATGLGLMAAADLLASSSARPPHGRLGRELLLLGELQLVLEEGDRAPPPPAVSVGSRQQQLAGQWEPQRQLVGKRWEGQVQLEAQLRMEEHDNAVRIGKEEEDVRCGEVEAEGAAGGGLVAMPWLASHELRVRAPTCRLPAPASGGGSCGAGAWSWGREAAPRAMEVAFRQQSGQAAAAVGGDPGAAAPFCSGCGATVLGGVPAAPLLRLCSEPVAALAEQELRARRCRASASHSGLGSQENQQQQRHVCGASDTGGASNVDACSSTSGALSGSACGESTRDSPLSSRSGSSGGAGASFGHALALQPADLSCSPRVCAVTGDKSNCGSTHRSKHVSGRQVDRGGDQLHVCMGAASGSAWLLGGFGGHGGAAGSFDQAAWELQRKRC